MFGGVNFNNRRAFWIGRHRKTKLFLAIPLFALMSLVDPRAVFGQDRLKTMPGYARYQKLAAESTNAVKLGSLIVIWQDDGKALEYEKDEKRYRFDIVTKSVTPLAPR